MGLRRSALSRYFGVQSRANWCRLLSDQYGRHETPPEPSCAIVESSHTPKGAEDVTVTIGEGTNGTGSPEPVATETSVQDESQGRPPCTAALSDDKCRSAEPSQLITLDDMRHECLWNIYA